MALDGITTSAIVSELKSALVGGRIDKIHQPVADEIRMTIRGLGSGAKKIIISANSAHPRMHLTESSRENPMTAPLFCMVMRKHIAGGKIVDILQPNFERIIIMRVESANEMGDITTKNLILEIMGKHSNLILTDENGKITKKVLSAKFCPAKNMFSLLPKIRKTLWKRKAATSFSPCICRKAENCKNSCIRPIPASAPSWLGRSVPVQGWMHPMPVRKPPSKKAKTCMPPSIKPCPKSKQLLINLPSIIRKMTKS